MYVNFKEFKEKEHNDISSLNSFNDVATLLGVSRQHLWTVLIKQRNQNYFQFSIPKKSGGYRLIQAPHKSLKFLQKKLSLLLNDNYRADKHAYGFEKGKSIVLHAQRHVKKRYILNFDLQNFFHTITYQRVYGFFKNYYKLNQKVAGTLANICCHPDGYLPQGAPTSPIISNMLANTLDKKLSSLARKNNCRYSRYVDDITFSTDKREFPPVIATYDSILNETSLSNVLSNIIEKEGFLVNEGKTRMNPFYERQTVTGMVVNEKVNVNRSYIRYVRALLHSLITAKKDNNIEYAEKKFDSLYSFRYSGVRTRNPDIYTVIRGMISFIGQVKGLDDSVYIKLAKSYNTIVTDMNYPMLTKIHNDETYVIRNTFVIESEFYKVHNKYFSEEEVMTGQGTGFLLKGKGFITNAHVISDYITGYENSDDIDSILVHQDKYNGDLKEAKIKKYCIRHDLALLEIDGVNHKSEGLKLATVLNEGMSLRVFGFPNYESNMDLSVTKGTLGKERRSPVENKLRYEVTARIRGGNSGGPVVNDMNEVIGVAVRGSEEHPSEIIPIENLLEFLES